MLKETFVADYASHNHFAMTNNGAKVIVNIIIIAPHCYRSSRAFHLRNRRHVCKVITQKCREEKRNNKRIVVQQTCTNLDIYRAVG